MVSRSRPAWSSGRVAAPRETCSSKPAFLATEQALPVRIHAKNLGPDSCPRFGQQIPQPTPLPPPSSLCLSAFAQNVCSSQHMHAPCPCLPAPCCPLQEPVCCEAELPPTVAGCCLARHPFRHCGACLALFGDVSVHGMFHRRSTATSASRSNNNRAAVRWGRLQVLDPGLGQAPAGAPVQCPGSSTSRHEGSPLVVLLT